MGCFCDTINGYEPIRVIGEGGFATIYEVKRNNKLYAMKQIVLNEKNKEQIESENSILKSFEHNNIVKYIDSFEYKNEKMKTTYFCIILEYCKSNLNQLKDKYKDEDLINPKLIYIIIKDICLGLKEIHSKKLVHRDINPNNILIAEDDRIKITDFNVSKYDEGNVKTCIGTYPYIAPEVMKKKEKYNYKADIWSLGRLICDLCKCSKCPEYPNYDISVKINSNYDKELENLINELVKKVPEQRIEIDQVLSKINKLELKYQDNDKFNNKDLDELSKQILERKKKNEIEITVNIENNDIKKNIFFLYNPKSLEHLDTEPYINNTESSEHLKELNDKNTELWIYRKETDEKEKINYKKFYKFPNKNKYKIFLKSRDILKDSSFMFANCQNIVNLDLVFFDTRNIIDMSSMFINMKLTSIDLSSFNTVNVKKMNAMFAFCINLVELDLSSFDTSKVEDMSEMFRYCKNLKKLNLSSFNTKNVTNMNDMFLSCENLEILDLTSFNITKYTLVKGLFLKCSNLRRVYINNNTFDISKCDEIQREYDQYYGKHKNIFHKKNK